MTDEERIARAICRSRGVDPDMCVHGSGSVSINTNTGKRSATYECSRYAWQNEIAAARAALEAVALVAKDELDLCSRYWVKQ